MTMTITIKPPTITKTITEKITKTITKTIKTNQRIIIT